MATFRPFSRLPPELRITIWKMTIEPRMVPIRERRGLEDGSHHILKTLHFMSRTRAPAVMHACHEARSILKSFYKQAYNFGLQPRYIWVNFAIDTIFTTTAYDGVLTHEYHLLRRITLTNDPYHFRVELLYRLPGFWRLLRSNSLEELVIVMDITQDYGCFVRYMELANSIMTMLELRRDMTPWLALAKVKVRHDGLGRGKKLNLEDCEKLYRRVWEEGQDAWTNYW